MGETLAISYSADGNSKADNSSASSLDGVTPETFDDATPVNEVVGEIDGVEDMADSFEAQLERLAGDEKFIYWIKREISSLHQYDLDAADIVQTALARMVGRDIQPEAVRTYAFMTAASIIATLGRKKTTTRNHLGYRAGLSEAETIIDDTAEDALYRVEAQVALRPVLQAILALPLRQREAVLYRCYMGLDVRQTAEVMGVAQGTVKASCSRGLKALRNSLSEEYR